MKLELNYDQINTIDLSYLFNKFTHPDRKHLLQSAGQEFHKLYAYIVNQFNDIKIADIGARIGNSALSLSHNNSNQVDSYETDKKYHECLCNLINKDNIRFFLQDILINPAILRYQLISLDVDPHNGAQEIRCFNYLKENNWNGIVLLDDIGPAWPNLHSWWNSIDLPKWDLTKYGHASGTGLVDFSNQLEIVFS